MRRKSLFGYVLQRLYTSGWEVKVLYAIVETAGRQYKVEEGKILYTEKQTEYAPGDEIVFDRVVLLRKDNEVLVGKPYVEGARVVGKVLEHAKARKVKTVKYRPRKNSKVEKGHRQWYTAIKIEKIEV
ncbi:50S ribosomal protein L21 [Thermotoga neapolitana DSM 4359]|uniref:Large ribosomal subunit protein bL21 n=1 Tax=Thermotoga neapolitana (strain ATCC 49049 / DSM 4359 / NBRC 107923 / NS-E) TaxID=309803 RepID=B9K8C8_THENN|nr:50S ribosomal protein L21 [Thermotoga neapolitana DSM 4359]